MSGVDLLLDTNAAIAITKEDSLALARLLAFQAPALSLFTLGELKFGVLKSSFKRESLQAVERLRAAFSLLLPDDRTARYYAEIRLRLRRKGRPIPENDVWIAALALQRQLPLMSQDSHFHEIDALSVLSW